MNYIHSQKLIYWGLPRTGSRYVFGCLGTAYDLKPHTSHTHKTCLDPEYSDYSIVCSVRNPYSRVLSAWKWLTELDHLPDSCAASFPDFVRRFVPNVVLPLTLELEDRMDKVNYVVRIEDCEVDLKKLPNFPQDFDFPPNRFKSTYRLSPKEYYADPATVARIWDTYREDFESFGYGQDSHQHLRDLTGSAGV